MLKIVLWLCFLYSVRSVEATNHNKPLYCQVTWDLCIWPCAVACLQPWLWSRSFRKKSWCWLFKTASWKGKNKGTAVFRSYPKQHLVFEKKVLKNMFVSSRGWLLVSGQRWGKDRSWPDLNWHSDLSRRLGHHCPCSSKPFGQSQSPCDRQDVHHHVGHGLHVCCLGFFVADVLFTCCALCPCIVSVAVEPEPFSEIRWWQFWLAKGHSSTPSMSCQCFWKAWRFQRLGKKKLERLKRRICVLQPISFIVTFHQNWAYCPKDGFKWQWILSSL